VTNVLNKLINIFNKLIKVQSATPYIIRNCCKIRLYLTVIQRDERTFQRDKRMLLSDKGLLKKSNNKNTFV